MNILDIAENSVRAQATLVEILLEQDTGRQRQVLTIRDNGKGMDAEMVLQVTDPFCTTRTTRKVGLGLPFLKMAAEMTNGSLHIESTPGKGTAVIASFALNHIDLAPLGDMPATISALAQTNPDIDFVYRLTRDGATFIFDTREAKELLGEVRLSEPSVALFIRDYVEEQTREILDPKAPAQE